VHHRSLRTCQSYTAGAYAKLAGQLLLAMCATNLVDLALHVRACSAHLFEWPAAKTVVLHIAP
jgi:hypothetical protein